MSQSSLDDSHNPQDLKTSVSSGRQEWCLLEVLCAGERKNILDRRFGCAFVFYHHHLVEFPRSDPLAFGGAVAVWSQAASPRGPGHPREELTKSDNLGWRPAQTSSPLSFILQHPIPCGQGNHEPSYPPDPGKVARACHWHSAKGSLARVGWRVLTRGQGKIPCSMATDCGHKVNCQLATVDGDLACGTR